MSGDIFFFFLSQPGGVGERAPGISWVQARDALKYPKEHKTAPSTISSRPKYQNAKPQKPWSKRDYFVCNLLFLATKGEKHITLTSLRSTVPWLYALGHLPVSEAWQGRRPFQILHPETRFSPEVPSQGRENWPGSLLWSIQHYTCIWWAYIWLSLLEK